MTQLKTPDNRLFDTKDLPAGVELLFCKAEDCGQRMGAFFSGHTDEPITLCEECTARLANGELTPDGNVRRD